MKIALKLSQVGLMHAALKSFDRYEKSIKVAGGTEAMVKVPYDLNPATRFAMAKNMAVLSAVMDNLNEARNSLVKQLSDDGLEVPKEKLAQFNSQLNDLLDSVEEVDLALISWSDLKPEANPIPPSVAADMMPLLTAEEESSG